MTIDPDTSLREEATTDGEGETRALGAELAKHLVAGDVVLLIGELGTGKTTFVRGVAEALGVVGPVTSPTYSIAQRYTKKPLWVALLVSAAPLVQVHANSLDTDTPALAFLLSGAAFFVQSSSFACAL